MFNLELAKEIVLIKNNDNTYNLTTKTDVYNSNGKTIKNTVEINCPKVMIKDLNINVLASNNYSGEVSIEKDNIIKNCIIPTTMYRIKEIDYKVQVVCNKCHSSGEVLKNCYECGGKGVHNKTKKKWAVHIHPITIDKIDRDKNGELRFWTDMSCFFQEKDKLVHFTFKDALNECWNRNHRLL